MRLEQFEYLIEIKKHTSLSESAQQLHLSPQALSKSITGMETELGYTILNRTYKGVQLTEKGEQIVIAAERFFADLAAINGEPQSKLPILKGRYTIFLSVQGEVNFFLLALLTTLSQDFPLLEINTCHYQPEETIKRIAQGEAEIGMYCTYSIEGKMSNQLPSTLQFTPIMPCKIYAIIPNNLSLAAYKSISIKSLLSYPLIMQRTQDGSAPYFFPLIESFGKPKQMITKSSSVLCHELASAGVGIYLQIVLQGNEPQVKEPNQITILPIRDNIQITFGYLTKKERPLSLITETIIKYIHELSKKNINQF